MYPTQPQPAARAAGAHAKWPDPSVASTRTTTPRGREKLTRLVITVHQRWRVGAVRPLDNVVSLLPGEEQIGNDRCQFYARVPIPDEFCLGGRRTREVTVALAYSPSRGVDHTVDSPHDEAVRPARCSPTTRDRSGRAPGAQPRRGDGIERKRNRWPGRCAKLARCRCARVDLRAAPPRAVVRRGDAPRRAPVHRHR